MSGVGPDGMQSMSSVDGCGSSAGSRSVMMRAVSWARCSGECQAPRERHAAQSLGDRVGLPLAALGAQRAVGEAVLGILLLAVAHEVEVVDIGVT